MQLRTILSGILQLSIKPIDQINKDKMLHKLIGTCMSHQTAERYKQKLSTYLTTTKGKAYKASMMSRTKNPFISHAPSFIIFDNWFLSSMIRNSKKCMMPSPIIIMLYMVIHMQVWEERNSEHPILDDNSSENYTNKQPSPIAKLPNTMSIL